MKYIAIVLLMLLIAGCDNSEDLKTVGDVESHKTFDRTGKAITITVTLYANQSDIDRMCRTEPSCRAAIEADREGFAVWNELSNGEEPDNLTCNIHAQTPRKREDARTTFLGHELLHCVWGSYHD